MKTCTYVLAKDVLTSIFVATSWAVIESNNWFSTCNRSLYAHNQSRTSSYWVSSTQFSSGAVNRAINWYSNEERQRKSSENPVEVLVSLPQLFHSDLSRPNSHHYIMKTYCREYRWIIRYVIAIFRHFKWFHVTMCLEKGKGWLWIKSLERDNGLNFSQYHVLPATLNISVMPDSGLTSWHVIPILSKAKCDWLHSSHQCNIDTNIIYGISKTRIIWEIRLFFQNQSTVWW